MAHTTVQQMRLAVDLLDQGNEQACITTLQDLLLQPNLPPFWRIHALALLAHTVDDWFEAKVRLSSSPGVNNADQGVETSNTRQSAVAVQSQTDPRRCRP
jgi:hypothetical protein